MEINLVESSWLPLKYEIHFISLYNMMPSTPVKKLIENYLFLMRKYFINSDQKIQHSLLFLTRMLVLMPQSTTYGLLCSSTQWHKRMARKEVIFVEFLGIFNEKLTT